MHTQQQDSVTFWLAKQQIAELQQLYGVATDLIGQGSEQSIAEGREIYHQIFTADAQIGAAGVDPKTGPDAWVELVAGALATYQDTQHLIGTQRVTIADLPDDQGQRGSAHLTSYLQAWHAEANQQLWLFIGSYESDVVYSPEHGWQISNMMLNKTSEDLRQITVRD